MFISFTTKKVVKIKNLLISHIFLLFIVLTLISFDDSTITTTTTTTNNKNFNENYNFLIDTHDIIFKREFDETEYYKFYFHCNSLICDFYVSNSFDSNKLFKNKNIEREDYEKYIRLRNDQILEIDYKNGIEIFCNVLSNTETYSMVGSIGILQNQNELINDIIKQKNENDYKIIDSNSFMHNNQTIEFNIFDISENLYFINENYLVFPYLQQKKIQYLEINQKLKIEKNSDDDNKEKKIYDRYSFSLNPLFSRDNICDILSYNNYSKDNDLYLITDYIKDSKQKIETIFDLCGGFNIKFGDILIEKNVASIKLMNNLIVKLNLILIDIFLIVFIYFLNYYQKKLFDFKYKIK